VPWSNEREPVWEFAFRKLDFERGVRIAQQTEDLIMSRKMVVIIFAAATVAVVGTATSARAFHSVISGHVSGGSLRAATMSHPTAFSHPVAANHPTAFNNPVGAGAVAFPGSAFRHHGHHVFISPRLASSDYPFGYLYRLRFSECFRRVWTTWGGYWENVCGYDYGY
jgi:hypothetical protein